ncbi:MAG: hypothetical protein JWM33_434 [Caulobacteraceae bacterium]|nr:hypothetical protein [Caulobacteraceae bacterium]
MALHRPLPLYDPEISWATLAKYMLALRQFIGLRAPVLAAGSFARIAAMNEGDRPRVGYLPLPTNGIGYRRYEGKSRRALLLVHGSGGYGDQMHALARGVASRGEATVYTLSMCGHGLSDGRPGHAAGSPREMVDSLSAFVAHLRATGEFDGVYMGGHSAGGGLVLGFARANAPAQVDGYLFLAPYLGLGSPTIRPRFGGWVKARPAPLLLVAAANLFGVKRFNHATVVDFAIEACPEELRLAPSWSFNTLLAFGPGRWLPKAPPLAADKPVLVTAGRRDECFHPSLYPKAFDVIAPHAEFVETDGGHWDVLVDPVTIEAVGLWLSRQPLGRQAPKSHRKSPLKDWKAA